MAQRAVGAAENRPGWPSGAGGSRVAFGGVPAPPPTLRRELVLWMVVLRRIGLLVGAVVGAAQQHVAPGLIEPWAAALVLGGVAVVRSPRRQRAPRPSAALGAVRPSAR